MLLNCPTATRPEPDDV